jgi:hypothetical protein
MFLAALKDILKKPRSTHGCTSDSSHLSQCIVLKMALSSGKESLLGLHKFSAQYCRHSWHLLAAVADCRESMQQRCTSSELAFNMDT